MLNNDTVANPISTTPVDTFYVLIVHDLEGCVDIDSVVVEIPIKPVTADAGGPLVCSGGTAILGGNPTGNLGIPPYTYQWAPSIGLNYDTISNPVTTISIDTTYVVTVTDMEGCMDIDSVDVVINPNGPWAEAGYEQDTLCTGGSIMIGGNPTASGGTPSYTYAWIPSQGLNDTTISNPIASINMDTYYVVIVMDSEGCMDIDTVYLDFRENGPWAEAGFGEDTICSGGTVMLGGNPTGSGGQTPYQYQWTPATGLNDSTVSNPITTIGYDFIYTLFLTDGEGCKDIDSVTVIMSGNGPYAEAGWGYDEICLVDSQQLGGDPTAWQGQSPYTYAWTPNYMLNDSTISNPWTYSDRDTTYTLFIEDARGCRDIDSVKVIKQLLDASFETFYQKDIVPEDVLFTNTSIGASVYDWDFGDEQYSEEVDPIHTYTDGGTITITLIAYTDLTLLCSDTARYTIRLHPPSSIEVPNVFTPNGDGMNDLFLVRSRGIEEFELVIFDRWGLELYSFDQHDLGWDGYTYSGIKAPDGTYFYVIKATGIDKKYYSLKGTFMLLN